MTQPNLLSEREKEVVELLLQGKSNKQIALALGISDRTVEFHLKNVYSKLQVRSRTEAILKLGKSTGNEPAESTVAGMGESADNDGKPISPRRIPMKNLFYIIGGLLTATLVVVLTLANLPAKGADAAPTMQASSTFVSTESTMPSPTPMTETCTSVRDVKFCVRGVALTRDVTYVMLEIKTPLNVQAGDLGFMLPGFGETSTLPMLRDDNGKENNTLDADSSLIVFPGADNQTFLQTLKFPPLDQSVKKAVLKFSLVGFFIPSQSSFQLDIGKNPQPGQVIVFDQTISIQGQDIHLTKAEFSGAGVDSLFVDVWSDPVQLNQDIAAFMPVLGIPDGTNMGTGFGSKWILPGSPFHAFAELAYPGKAPVSGLITIPVAGATFYYQGDFQIPFSIPASGLSSEIAPTLEQLAQIAEIRQFAHAPNLEPVFITFESIDNAVWSALYFTKDGSKYWVETQTRGITQFESGNLSNSSVEVKNMIELKNIAQDFAFGNSIKFSRLYDKLTFSSKNDSGAYTFRWESQKVINVEVPIPSLEIVIAPDGRILRYTNTLDFVQIE